MATEIGCGLVGADMVARYHAAAIDATPGARLAAICRADRARGTFAATTAAAPGFPHRVEIYGTRGGAQIEGDGLTRWEGDAPRIRPTAPSVADAGSGASPTGIGTTGHTLILRDFIESIRRGREPLVGGDAGRRSLALVLAVYDAAGLSPCL